MPGYPVIWKAPGEKPIAGRLELGASGLTLSGAARPGEHRIEIEYDEIVGAGRSLERVGRLPALRLTTHDLVGALLIAPFGAGLNSEILEQLDAALARVV